MTLIDVVLVSLFLTLNTVITWLNILVRRFYFLLLTDISQLIGGNFQLLLNR